MMTGDDNRFYEKFVSVLTSFGEVYFSVNSRNVSVSVSAASRFDNKFGRWVDGVQGIKVC